jgi:hypothetical protein
VLLALLLTNRGSNHGWQIVLVVFLVAPIVLAMALRYFDRRRRR